MKIKSADFVMSNSKVDHCPKDPIPEYAFIGRSNVGKSSLINMLTQRKSLAKTSGRPGKTQLINHFKINENWFLVDLPGYGYARVSKKDKKTFQKYITDYFLQRRQLVCAFVLVDIRHEPQKVDLEFMEWMGENQIPFSIIFTKADKLKPNVIEKNVEDYIQQLLSSIWEEAPHYFITSSSNGTGQEEVLNYIDEMNENFKKNNWADLI
ncbi:ribosome biogenesis GTP-binding protein YihA/YsxC [Cellulophaga baltica]|uniref:ribosome biogenesis GTP-binding protein YihA/YsxC n=1 Tax=Cellulophaga TaxID=104264 RepID=UPI001C073FC7|nr:MULTISPECIES: ribosome biogenesis GTP-binding protein YihA/YsxC [Cellulophaga]MBU2995078.1 ribosome biogenesis GTP-binding protein YihA/YsxC [Cellulophaga baltica]MDO6766473.1 ribosome biogenesis GTP-binding protein YihA/YsxC [Cellulophaga sp. 1_MG-2023]